MPPRTLDFPSLGAAIVERAGPVTSQGNAPLTTQPEPERVRRALDYLREHAPEPHVANLRVALRAGITPLALERPDTLTSNKMTLIEAAVGEILGVDLADIGRGQ